MCVIVYKPAGVTITYQDLKSMWNTNPDGAGIVVLRYKVKTTVYKGYLSFRKFYEQYQRVASEDLLLHFRLGTGGRVESRNCHPFVVKLPGQPKLYLMHNGIIPGYGNRKITDTEDYIQKVLNNEKSVLGIINTLDELLHGKFVLFDEHGNLHLIGKFEEYKDLICSNLYFIISPTERELIAKEI